MVSLKNFFPKILMLVFLVLIPNILTTYVQASSKIVASVDRFAITNNDVRRRAALLRLQRTRGNLNTKAKEQLIEEALKLNEARRRNVTVPEARVDDAFAGFARRNKLSIRQLNQVLNRAGVGPKGFKDFIRAQIAWNALVRSRLQSSGGGAGAPRNINELLFQAEKQAKASEFVLQQVVFFANKSNKKSISQRISEAKVMKSGFTDCQSTPAKATAYQDVVVRSLGRVSENNLPPDWKKFIVSLSQGETTAIRKTERGAEFIAVCRKSTIGREGGSEAGFNLGLNGGERAEKVSEEYLAELRERAIIR